VMARYLREAHIAAPYSPHALRQSVCHPPPECGRALGGGERTHGALLHQHDPALHPAV
jgi:hypothetical protein